MKIFRDILCFLRIPMTIENQEMKIQQHDADCEQDGPKKSTSRTPEREALFERARHWDDCEIAVDGYQGMKESAQLQARVLYKSQELAAYWTEVLEFKRVVGKKEMIQIPNEQGKSVCDRDKR